MFKVLHMLTDWPGAIPFWGMVFAAAFAVSVTIQVIYRKRSARVASQYALAFAAIALLSFLLAVLSFQ